VVEKEQLRAAIMNGEHFALIAERHERTPRAIEARAERLGLMTPTSAPPSDNFPGPMKTNSHDMGTSTATALLTKGLTEAIVPRTAVRGAARKTLDQCNIRGQEDAPHVERLILLIAGLVLSMKAMDEALTADRSECGTPDEMKAKRLVR
jgi:hypothetical protein